MYYVAKERDGRAVIDHIVNNDKFDADGIFTLSPGEKFFNVDVKNLAEGVYDEAGKFVEPLK